MKYRKFSDLDWNVSEVGLGCWQIGWCWGDVTEHDARDLLKKSLDKGVNFFDTSDTYGDGRSEKFLAELNTMTVEKNVEVNANDEAIEFLIKKGFNAKMGARPLQRVIYSQIKKPLPSIILFAA